LKDVKDSKLPSLKVLSDIRLLDKHRYVRIAPLAGKDWKAAFESNISPFKEPFSLMNSLCSEHYENFWGKYDLKMDFEFEAKQEHMSIRTAYIQKAHYVFTFGMSKQRRIPNSFTKFVVFHKKI
jgi:hypothetical protein